MSEATLHLHEEILLLALDDEKGTVAGGTMWRQAAGGAVIAELLLQGRLRATEDKKPKFEVVDATPLGDPVLDDFLEEIGAAKKPKKGAEWVRTFGSRGKMKERIADGLVRKGVLTITHGKILGIFNQTRYPEQDGCPEKEVVARLRRAIFEDGVEVAPRTMVLVSLCDAVGLLPRIFEKSELKGRKEHIKKLANGEMVGKMAREAVDAVRAAVMVACIMPTIIVTTTTS